jgi:hypothetical protein
MKIPTIKQLTIISFFCISFLSINTAHAAMVQFTLEGEISYADQTNMFGLSAGDIVTAAGVYDDAPLGPGSVFIQFATAYNNMDINIGNTLFTDAMDTIGGADLYFTNGVFEGLDYEATDNSFDSWGYLFFTGYGIEGYWTQTSFHTTVIPVPAAVWLFASGLFLLGGMARRKQLSVL